MRLLGFGNILSPIWEDPITLPGATLEARHSGSVWPTTSDRTPHRRPELMGSCVSATAAQRALKRCAKGATKIVDSTEQQGGQIARSHTSAILAWVSLVSAVCPPWLECQLSCHRLGAQAPGHRMHVSGPPSVLQDVLTDAL